MHDVRASTALVRTTTKPGGPRREGDSVLDSDKADNHDRPAKQPPLPQK